MTNNGVIRTSATGSVLLNGVLTMGPTGQFISDAQPIVFNQSSITGGAIDAINGGKFVHGGIGTVTLSGVTINGNFDVITSNGGVAVAGAGVTNNGTMTVDSQGLINGQLFFAGGTTLGGSGQVILNRAVDGTKLISEGGGASFTQGASHTIRGAGFIQVTMVNNGSIIAEPRNGTLLRTSNSQFTNNNLMQADNGATLRLEGGGSVTQSAAGRIRAANGGVVELNGGSVTGGKLQTAGTGVINSAKAFLTDVTNEGALEVPNTNGSNSAAFFQGTFLTNNGVITVNPAGTTSSLGTVLNFTADMTLQGTGTVVLNSTDARITTDANNKTITHAAGHTIRGKGFLNTSTYINHGRLEGASAAEPLFVFGHLSGDGPLEDVTFGGSLSTQFRFTLGDVGSAAIVPAEGVFTIARNSTMQVDLAGTTPGSGYDQLASTGTVSITTTTNTRLEVSRVAGFFPTPGQSFTLITATESLTGNFGTVQLPDVPQGLSWTQSQTANSLSISLMGSIAADFDEDGDVDRDDLGRWRAGYGMGSLHTQGNADGDADVDGADFLVWQRSLGWGVTPPVGAAAPEPSTAVLMLLGALLGRRLRPCAPVC
jgi:hypothetical protein